MKANLLQKTGGAAPPHREGGEHRDGAMVFARGRSFSALRSRRGLGIGGAVLVLLLLGSVLVALAGNDAQAPPDEEAHADQEASDTAKPSEARSPLRPRTAEPVEWRPPHFSTAQQPSHSQAQRVLTEALQQAEASGASVGAVLLDPQGKMLAAHEASRPHVPASSAKLLTSGAALAGLGPEFTFTTRLVADGPLERCEEQGHRTLQGDLVLLGDGDPAISSRFDDEGEPLGPLRRWAHGLAEQLELREIDGQLVCDPRVFERTWRHPSWPQDQLLRWYVAPISGLTLEEGCFRLIVEADGAGGSRASLRTEPSSQALDLTGNVSLTAGRGNPLIHLEALDDDPAEIQAGTVRQLRVRGRLPRQTGRYATRVTVRDPERYVAELLAETLAEAGIEVRDGIRVAREPVAFGRQALELARHRTPIEKVVRVTNRESQNLYAEHLLKRLDTAVTGKPGSWESGGSTLTTWLEQWGVPSEGVQIADGSGMSRDNRVSAITLAGLLQAMNAAASQTQDRRATRMAEQFRDSLAVAGERGTLSRRLHRLSGRVWAKTGTLRGVISLAGYVRLGEGDNAQWYPFAILTENFPSNAAARGWIDQLLVNWHRAIRHS